MAAIRNGNPIRVNNIAIQPAYAPILAPVPPGVTTPVATPSVGVSSVIASPIVSIATNVATTRPVQTTANPIFNISTTVPTVAPVVSTVLDPIVALTGRSSPPVSSPVIFVSRPTPVRLLTSRDMVEETLSLDTHTFLNGQPVLDISSLRTDIVSLVDFKPIYNPYEHKSFSNFGLYFDDLYQSSLIRDTLRKYLLLNKASTTPIFNNTLQNISTRVRDDIAKSKRAIATLDGMIAKIQNINDILDVKTNLDTAYSFTTPYLGLRQFVTQRMLFAEASYNNFSDTKVLYQLLFDLGGILEKCSFNLIDRFVDAARSAYITTPTTNRQQNIQDSITIDLTYGDNLSYTPDAIRGKYINQYVVFNGVLNVFPLWTTDRFKFIVNLLSKELKVSKGLGKYNMPEASFFGFGNQGNPFDNIIGGIPSDIFISPTGNNSLSTLFYLRTSTQNAVVLPFENRQVAGDGQTVFVPGTNYFSDGILNGDFSTYNSYRETFSSRISQARNVFNRYIFTEDETSSALQSQSILRSALRYYNSSQELLRQNNNDATSVLSFVLFSLGNARPDIKFEIYKLLLLIIVYDTRTTVTTNTPQTDRFRDLLFGELARQQIQGFSENLTEQNVARLLESQIAIVKQLVLTNVDPLPVSTNRVSTGLSNNNSVTQRQNQQAVQVGRNVASPPPDNRNPNNNIAQVQIQQFSNLIYSLRSKDNLFKNVLDMCNELFVACSTNEQTYHLIEGSSVTRYHGLTLSGFVLLVFEMFSTLVNQFATSNIQYNLVSDQAATTPNTQYIQVSLVIQSLLNVSNDITNFARNGVCSNPIINDYETKLEQEDKIIDNILQFFEQLNLRFSRIAPPTATELANLRAINTNNPNSISTTRTAKNILQYIVNKQPIYNPANIRALDFYLPAGKAISEKNWEAVKTALFQPEFVGSAKRKLITVGIPYGFVKSVLGARLNKSNVYNGKLEESTSDLINIKIYKLDKNDDGIIFKPQQFKFDLSLFPKGFDANTVDSLARSNYYGLRNVFEFYDFDEATPFDQVTAKTYQTFVNSDPYYRQSSNRQLVCFEAVENLYRSFVFDMYLHMVTGLNTSEETFIAYSEAETSTFMSEMAKIPLGTADLTKIKFMTPEYSDLLRAYQDHPDDTKLMLTLCNDITKTVFRQKVYDRTYNIMFDIDKFAVDTNAMNQSVQGHALLQKLTNEGRLYQTNGQTFKTSDDLVLDSYFINVEIIQ